MDISQLTWVGSTETAPTVAEVGEYHGQGRVLVTLVLKKTAGSVTLAVTRVAILEVVVVTTLVVVIACVVFC